MSCEKDGAKMFFCPFFEIDIPTNLCYSPRYLVRKHPQ